MAKLAIMLIEDFLVAELNNNNELTELTWKKFAKDKISEEECKELRNDQYSKNREIMRIIKEICRIRDALDEAIK